MHPMNIRKLPFSRDEPPPPKATNVLVENSETDRPKRIILQAEEMEGKFLDEINGRTYSRAARKMLYAKEYWLPPEASLLLDFGQDILGRKVLELGAGSGRLSGVLHLRAAEYIATDVNRQMISALHLIHPQVKALVADARNLISFPDGYFNTVIFSFNGIDSLSFEERPKALWEIFRVLASGGAFIHSTHNLKYALDASHRPSSTDARVSLTGYLRRLWNRRRLARLEVFSSRYAVVNDRALENGLLNVYVSPQEHFSHLSTVGFLVDAIYNRLGCRLPENEWPDDQWYYLVARKSLESR